MNPAVVARHGRNLLSILEINANRLLGRQFVPLQRDIAIEPTSVCNLDCCFCAYGKKQTPKIAMKQDRFADYVGQAAAMGFRNVYLTPSTGDIFMDRHIFEKFELLERHPDIAEYYFYTNFTIPDAEEIARLATLRKLKFLTVSVYGHDRETFVRIARSTEKVYQRLLANLETLLPFADRLRGILHIAIRSTRDMPRGPTTDLLKMLDRFRQAGIPVKRSQLYHNWAGYVTPQDQQGLAIDLVDSSKIYKKGACALLFNGIQIMATGVVHACACVDVDGSLKIGDLNERPLREILSPDNATYMDLIREQERGAFKPVCQNCGFYKSIYHNRSLYRKSSIATGTVDDYESRLRASSEDAAGTPSATTRPCAAESP